MQQKSIHPAFVYGLVGVCAVSILFGHQQATQTRPERMKQWQALSLDVAPPPLPAFCKRLNQYPAALGPAHVKATERQPSRSPLLASATALEK
jgi:hypothetical protein